MQMIQLFSSMDMDKVTTKTKRNALIRLRGVFSLAMEEELIIVNAVRLKKY